MSATTLTWPGRSNLVRLPLRAIDASLTAWGESCLDAVRLTRGPVRSNRQPDEEDIDDELRLMIALYCAGFH
jgi:hypothetical protein